jgi:hypothetical protein
VALVKGEQPPRLVAVRGDDHAQVGETSIKILVAAFEVCDDAVVVRFKVSDYEPTSCEIFDEAEASTASEPTAEQVVDLCSHGSRKYKLAWLLSQHRFYSRTQAVAAISDRYERSGIEDDRQSPKPSSSSTAGTSAMEPPGPSATPIRAKFLSPLRSGS